MQTGSIKPRKILMTADTVGGVWRYCFDLAAELVSQHEVEILLATMGPRPSAEQKREVEALGAVKLKESDWALEWQPNAEADISKAAHWLLDVQQSFNADLIHLNGYAHATLPWGSPVLIAAHSCVYSWWHAVHGTEPDADWQMYRHFVAEGLSACDAVVAPSHFMAAELARLYGRPVHKTKVVYNFTREPWPPMQEKQPFCLAAGRMWDQAKNLRLLEGIAPQVPYTIRVAGANKAPNGGPSSSTVGSLEYLGQLAHADLLERMSAAEIFLHPALYEPFGLVVLEAARASCALVLADTSSLREIWDGAAVFVEPRDAERWSAELISLIADPGRRRMLGERARSHASRYQTQESVKAYWDLYSSLLTGGTDDRKDAAA